MTDARKRKAEGPESSRPAKRKQSKGPKKWRVPRKDRPVAQDANVEYGDAGFWVTCIKDKETKCSYEVAHLLDEYFQTMDHDKLGDGNEAHTHEDDAGGSDVEASIGNELLNLKEQRSKRPYAIVKTDTPCVLFCKIRPPTDPGALVRRICDDARQRDRMQQSRFIQRLTPVARVGKATEGGLDEVAKIVLEPHFHAPQQVPKKFAIRTTIRNHNSLARDDIILRVAQAVGSPHTVDLKHYDLLILVEIWKRLVPGLIFSAWHFSLLHNKASQSIVDHCFSQNTCGMAVVGNDYEGLKRYNLLEIYRTGSATEEIGG